MKKITFSLLTLIICAASFAQNDNRKLPSLGIHFILNDFVTASELRANGLSNVLRDKQFSKIKRMSPGLAISYLQGVSKHVDFGATLSGSFVNYDVANSQNLTNREQLLLEAAATANIKLLSDKYALSPFITAGIGAHSYRRSFGAYLPLGVGLQLKIADGVFGIANMQYRVPVTDKAVYHLYHSIGVAAPLVKKPEPVIPPPPPPVVLDRDNDGILDADDKCPDVPGIAALQGCPDRDGDGIADADDKCPDVAGTAKYQGCPIPDTDADGINDELDKCPTEKGFARYQGCPIPDTDKDGVNDEEDKCPSRPGPASNQGCPEIAKEVIEKINIAAKNIFFATGSSKLLPKSFKSLNEVAALLAADESLMIAIDGHTDSTGKREKNLTLSNDRANSVKAYLATKGVTDSRMTATGYGPDKPVATNKTAAGRAKNRRVEMTVRNY
ncbi:MAG: OmpA family protein [Ferruginibacter sp.]